MPSQNIGEDGYIVVYTAEQKTAMNIRTFDVRSGGHPTETRKQDEITMTRTFLVTWAQRYAFCNMVVGDSQVWFDSVAGENKLVRVLPDADWGRHPTDDQIIATQILSIRGHGAGVDDEDNMPAYTDAEIEVQYEYIPFALGSQSAPPAQSELDRFVMLEDVMDVQPEVFGPLPGGTFKATRSGGGGLSGQQAPYNMSVTRAVTRFVVWWKFIPWELYQNQGALFERLNYGDTADTAQIPYIGTVNSHEITFSSFEHTYPAGTLLLEGVKVRKVRSPLAESGVAGLRADVGLSLAFAPRGWLDLYLLDPATPSNSGYYRMSANGTYYAVADMPDNNGLYNVRNFNNLFKADV